MKPESYILITPAKNEAKFIGALIESILAQTRRPSRWVIIDDGSTDQTGQIVQRYADLHTFISLLRLGSEKRSFGSKAKAFSHAYAQVKDLEFDFIGNLDADVTLQPDYYERVFERMGKDPHLGVAGGVIWDKTGETYKRSISGEHHTPGAVMLFRRRCLEDVGGVHPVSVAGEDSIALFTARMKGWGTRSYRDLPVYHHKPVGSSDGNACRQCHREGLTEYHIGTHPVFALAKAVRRIPTRPYFVGSLIRLAGYTQLWLAGAKRDASPELTAYVHREQLSRLLHFFRGTPPKAE